MTWRGVFSGALALIALQAVVSRADSAERVSSGLGWIATLVTAAIDPSKPAIPDLAGIGSGVGVVPDNGRDWAG